MPDLFPYQSEGSNFLASRSRAGLFDQMRLGKTRQILSAAKRLTVDTGIIVCKASGVYVWETEALEWGFNPLILSTNSTPQRNRLNILSYNASTTELFNKLIAMQSVSVVVGDESHYLKTLDAARTIAFYGIDAKMQNCIAALGANVWLATGTPAPNDPSELYSMFRALFPDAIIHKKSDKPATLNQFIGRYCKTVDTGWSWKIVGGKNAKDLRQRLLGRTLRRTTKQVWKETPATIINLLPIQAQIPKLHDHEEIKLREALASDDVLKALDNISESLPTLRRMIGLSKVEGVLLWLGDNLEQLGKVILFAYHKEVIQQLRDALPGHAHIIGGMLAKERKKQYTRFLEDPFCKVFIGQNHAAGDSIPLHSASTALMIEPEWTPKQNDQCFGRMQFHAKREACTGYYVTIPGTIDEDINRVFTRKTRTLESLGL